MDQPQRLSVVGLRILLPQLSRNRIQIFRRPPRRHARLKPANHRNRYRCPAMQVIRPLHLLLVHHGDPVVRPHKPLRAVELRRRYANHRKRMLVELYGRPDYAPLGMKRASP